MQLSNKITSSSTHLNRFKFNPHRFQMGISTALVLAVVIAGLMLTSSYFRSSASSKANRDSKLAVDRLSSGRITRTGAALARPANRFDFPKSSAMNVFSSFLPPASGPTVATFAADCTTAKTTFNLGDVVCAVTTNAGNERVAWADNLGYIRSYNLISPTGPATATFTIPATQSSTIANGELTVDNRGLWSAVVVSDDGASEAVAPFVVKDPSAPAADVEITTDQIEGDIAVPDAILKYEVSIINRGPDSATNARFTSTTPSNTTFQQLDQEPGSPTFTCTTPAVDAAGDINCSIASLAQGVRATFLMQFKVNSTAGGNAQIGTTATATSDTADVYPASNDSRADTSTPSQGGAGCDLTCPANITVVADTTGPNPADPGGPDVAGAIVTFSVTPGGSCGTITSSPASGSFFPVGSTIVSSSSSDGGGECSFTVTVTQSGGAVTISCPANVTANADSNCSATVTLGTPTTTGDNVKVTGTRSDGKPMYDCDTNGENCVRKSQDLPFSAGTTSVIWVASNSSGSESCTQTVTVVDVTPPVITASNQTASADASCQAAVPDFSTIALVTDNCACASSDNSQICDSRSDISVTQDVAAGTMVGLGPHTIHLTANDQSDNNGGAGNSTTVTVTFTVVDTTPPSITAPGPVTAYTGAGATTCDTVVDPGTATGSDNCGSVTITRSPSGNTFPVGATTITWTAKDGANNTTTATQTVTVIDNTPPVVSCPANITTYLPLNTTATSMTVSYPAATATDNCGGPINIGYSIASGSTFSVGTTPVTVTATDTHGNTASCTFTVTVLYDFTGFFSPVGNPPVLNTVNAGRAIPVKFSLSGNKGLGIMAAGNPYSVSLTCDTNNPGVDITETVTAGGSSLSYDASSDQYIYVWKTDSAWAGTCRQLVVTLNDGSVHVANFKFK